MLYPSCENDAYCTDYNYPLISQMFLRSLPCHHHWYSPNPSFSHFRVCSVLTRANYLGIPTIIVNYCVNTISFLPNKYTPLNFFLSGNFGFWNQPSSRDPTYRPMTISNIPDRGKMWNYVHTCIIAGTAGSVNVMGS